jgi:hypothetical protein
MKKIMIPAILILIITGAFRVYAEEQQVAMNEEGDLFSISKSLASDLGLFGEYPNFREGLLFQESGDHYVLEVTMEENGKLVRHRESMTAAGVLEFRKNVSRLILEKKPASALDQSGRLSLLIGTFLLSYGYYGWSIPAALRISDPGQFAGIYLLTSGLGFFVPFFVTGNAEVTQGQAAMALGSAYLGLIHGGLLHMVLFNTAVSTSNFTALNDLAITVTAVSMGEGVLGYFLSDWLDLDEGEASLISFLGGVGIGYGLGTAFLFDLPLSPDGARLMAADMLVTSYIGAAIGKVLADFTKYTAGDTTVLANMTWISAMGTSSALQIFNVTDTKIMAGSLMGVSLAGITAAHLFLASRNFTAEQGGFISLGTFGGALIGAGIAFIASPQMVPTWILPTSMFAGSALGFTAILLLYNGDAEKSGSAQKDPAAVNPLSIRFNPAGLLPAIPGGESSIGFSVPFLELHYRY